MRAHRPADDGGGGENEGIGREIPRAAEVAEQPRDGVHEDEERGDGRGSSDSCPPFEEQEGSEEDAATRARETREEPERGAKATRFCSSTPQGRITATS